MTPADWLRRYADEEVTAELVGHLLGQGFAVRVGSSREGLTLSGWDEGDGWRTEVDAYHARRRFAA